MNRYLVLLTVLTNWIDPCMPSKVEPCRVEPILFYQQAPEFPLFTPFGDPMVLAYLHPDECERNEK